MVLKLSSEKRNNNGSPTYPRPMIPIDAFLSMIFDLTDVIAIISLTISRLY